MKAERQLGEKVPWDLIEGSQRQPRRKIIANVASDDCMVYRAAKFAKKVNDDESVISDLNDEDEVPEMRVKSQQDDRVHFITLGDLTRRESTHWV